ncbi:MAG: hypothetical protein Q9184_002265 [Pyrenodesmia sp. 2 TL-2023]
MKEARLLHFSTGSPGGAWRLSCPASKGMPIEIDFQPKDVDAFAGKTKYIPGILEAITVVIGEEGPMYGWQVYSIGAKYDDPPAVMNAVVVVVREKAEQIEALKKMMGGDECICTPGSSVTMGH